MFSCQECGKKFKTVKAAERAIRNGCPGCGGVDIDLAPTDEQSERIQEQIERIQPEGPDSNGSQSRRDWQRELLS